MNVTPMTFVGQTLLREVTEEEVKDLIFSRVVLLNSRIKGFRVILDRTSTPESQNGITTPLVTDTDILEVEVSVEGLS